MSGIWLIDGAIADSIGAGDRGLHYGHGLFETMRVDRGEIPLWPRHRARLVRGARLLGIPLDEALLERELLQALRLWPDDGVAKLIVTAGAAGFGYRPLADARSTRILGFRPPPMPRLPLQVQVCTHRLPHTPALAGLKHLNRLDQVLAAKELAPECEGLLLDSSNRVIEMLSGNVFFKTATGWHTPILSDAGVRGVMRELLLDTVFPALGEAVLETEVSLFALSQVQAAFACNAVRGVEPIASIEPWNPALDVAAVAPVSAALHQLWPCFAD